jgi:hypothetical protein
MANRFPLVAYGMSVLTLTLALGCQSQPDTSLPDASFQPPPVEQPKPKPAPEVAIVTVKPSPMLPHTTTTPPPPAVRRLPQVASAVPKDWIPAAPIRPWRWIVIHHSATTFGNLAIINQWHIDRGFDEAGYHFIIGNGSRSGDGQIEVGPRWPKQKWGAHTKTPDNRFNDFGIGICLVGNFDIDHPTPAQLRSCAKLVAYLMKTYNIPPDRVMGHGDCKPTDCPGKNMSIAQVRAMATRILAEEETEPLDWDKLAQSGELMVDK